MGVYEYDATVGQKRKITQLCMALGISEPVEEKPMSFGVAGHYIRMMCMELRRKEKKECQKKKH